MNLKEKKKREFYKEVRELYHNAGLSIKELADRYLKTERTIYRWLKRAEPSQKDRDKKLRKQQKRRRRFPPEIFARIVELKKEIPQRSAPMIKRHLEQEFTIPIPSLSTIQKFLREEGLVYKRKEQQQGYKRFQRSKPNDLWQVDIAGVQTVGHLGQIYLIILIDDCSRFIVRGEYFRSEKGKNVIKVIRDAILSFGRPNEILADRGSQFWNVIGELATKYSKLLESLDIRPIFARAHHPQTKGKIERFFKTVVQMFLVEARPFVKKHPNYSLSDFNDLFNEWVDWYNTEKAHASLPDRTSPNKIYFNQENRIFRPLKSTINWEK